ncbi:MAG: type I pullulanase [Prevotella sp.]|nr:type I pullulanase [Prevotella sp.]
MKLKTLLLTTIVTIMGGTAAHAQGPETTYRKEATTFQVFAPAKAKRVLLRLYEQGEGGKPYKTIKMTTDKATPYIWRARVEGDLKGKFYTFDVTGTNRKWNETPGIFARAVSVNGQRGAIIDMNDTDPKGWLEDAKPDYSSPANLVIYELHHRDFSIDPSSGIENKGKYLALTEPKAIGHLKALGVNMVHILPSFDFASIDETKLDTPQYNWGYDPLNYNVPEGSYSTSPYDPVVRIREFKQMVQALHDAGIGVILDVVYNHTFDLAGSNFQKLYPGYFYRKNADGTWSNGSGCGNETASERDMMRLFLVESLKYWLKEYHIDGFRFDLMGVHDIETMNIIEKVIHSIDRRVFIYGEGWSAGQCAYPSERLATKNHIKKMPGIAAFSDDIRDALRGPFDDDTKGAFLASVEGSEESLKAGIAGMIDHPQVDYSRVNYSKEPWAEEPTQMISYVSCHDDMCLVDRLRTEMPGISEEELIRLDLLAQTAVFTSQGVPFMLSGEEMLRDKKGVHNSYNSPDSINRLDWTNLERYPQVFDYYRNLIRLRYRHEAFRLGKADLVRKHLEFLPVKESCMVAFRLKDHAGGDEWKDIIVVLNANKTAKKLEIPEGQWTVVCCEGIINEEGIEEIAGGEIAVSPQSALIIHN